MVLGGLGVLDGGGGRPLRRRQQRDHQRRRLQRGVAYGQTYGDGGHIRILSSAGNAGTGNPAGGLICQYDTTPEHRPLVTGSRPVPRRRRRGHRHRRRQLLPGRLGLGQGLRAQHGLWPGLERHPQRHHGRLARPGRRPGQRPARRRGGHAGRDHLRAQRHQRRRRLVRPDHGADLSAHRSRPTSPEGATRTSSSRPPTGSTSSTGAPAPRCHHRSRRRRSRARRS